MIPSGTKINQVADEKIVRLPDELQTAFAYARPRNPRPGGMSWAPELYDAETRVS